MNLHARFETIATQGGSKVFEAKDTTEISSILKSLFPDASCIVSTVEGISSDINLTQVTDPRSLKAVEVAVLRATLGIAENGAIWLSETDMAHRVLPFITQHLVVVLSKMNLVQNMHLAYQKIKVNESGFGVFISGPSKTADIEQSLVIGAQGARTHTIILI